ncbi:MAG: thiamine monophosphate synthase [Acidobacteriaceae bacterium]|nr:thiamine monophosphate synthase [Acidobacteriaceae bacterium]
MLRYAITHRAEYSGNPNYRLESVVRETAGWGTAGIEFIQLREKDLAASDQIALTRRILDAVRGTGSRVLVNARVDVAVAAGADGVHLTGSTGELRPKQVREVFREAGLGIPFVSMSCHSVAEVGRAREEAADAVLFGPVFGKAVNGVEVLPGAGLEELRMACAAAAGMPVFALGGVTWQRADECVAAGAVGVAGIRLFRG